MGVNQTNDLLAPPPVRSLGDDIAERLRAAILSGHFEPGERLGEERLARMMQVSRGPIRDALSRLERQGLDAVTDEHVIGAVRQVAGRIHQRAIEVEGDEHRPTSLSRLPIGPAGWTAHASVRGTTGRGRVVT